MSGQLSMEFLVSFMIFFMVVAFFIVGQKAGLDRIDRLMNQSLARTELDRIASACNLIYLNWKSAEFNFSFNLSNYGTRNNTLYSESLGKNLTSECLTNVSGTNVLEIGGVRRWF